MSLTKEVWESLPEEAKSAFVLAGEVYVPGKDATLKNTLNELDAKYKALEGQFSEVNKTKQAEIEQAKQAAFDEALAEALKSGDSDKIRETWEQKLADQSSRSELEIEGWKGKLNLIGEKMASSLIESLAVNATDAGKAAFMLLVKSRVQVDPETGEEIYLNADGSASSLNKEQFIIELQKDPVFMPVMKGSLPSANGIANGGSTSVAGKDPKEMNSKERIEFKQRDPEGFKKAFNL